MHLIAIKSIHWLIGVRPDLGACIESAHFQGQAVLRSSPQGSLSNVRLSGSYPLIPFSNRIGHARLQWNGTSHPLVKNFEGEAHSIHGIGWQRNWEVLEQADDFCMLSLAHDGKGAWPFAFDASQTFRVSANTLSMTLAITNQSPNPAPVGLGWHPYFVKTPGAQLQFEARSMWEMASDKLPSGERDHAGLHQAVDTLDVDNCFSGWSGTATLQDAKRRCTIESDVEHLVVFTNAEKDFIAIEPVSHANNAMNAANPKESEARGVRILQSGQSWQVSMSITVESF